MRKMPLAFAAAAAVTCAVSIDQRVYRDGITGHAHGNTANISPWDFGAKFDGVSDDSHAWVLTIGALQNFTYGARVVEPPGRSIITNTLSISLLGNQALSFNGAGSDVSELVWTSPVDGIHVDFDDAASNTRDAWASGAKLVFEGVSLVSGVPFVRGPSS